MYTIWKHAQTSKHLISDRHSKKELNTWCIFLLDKLVLPHFVKLSACYKTRGCVTMFRRAKSGIFLEPFESNPHHSTVFLCTTYVYVILGLPHRFPSGFPTKSYTVQPRSRSLILSRQYNRWNIKCCSPSWCNIFHSSWYLFHYPSENLPVSRFNSLFLTSWFSIRETTGSNLTLISAILP